ncbi:metalloregulator ArsR/SmtB family transcription factor [Mesorhizobium sp. M1050]|uniref:ArsR/SmtB family transcription factor n=1 Tax=Mesorhizobium sp. M1050 TaxID=2957051 RepID=UPI00333A9587
MVSDRLRANAQRAAEFLEVLGNARRLHILSLLHDNELPFRKIRERLGISRAALCQHMAKLRTVGLVKVRYEGRKIYYSSENRAARDLLCKLNVVDAGQQSAQPAAPNGADVSGPCAPGHSRKKLSLSKLQQFPEDE